MKLFADRRGDGPRTAALVHGASESSTVWAEFADILIERYDFSLIIVDQRGHGRSPRSDRYTLDSFTQDLIDTVPTGIDLLIGQSLGGRVAAEASPRIMPRRFIGIDPGFAVSRRFAVTMQVMHRLRPLMSRDAIRSSGIRRTGAALIDRQMANWDAWDSTMVPYLVRTGRRDQYKPRRPAVPSTLVLAPHSAVISTKRAREFEELGWDVRTLPDAPHDMHLRMPTQLAALLDDTLRAE